MLWARKQCAFHLYISRSHRSTELQHKPFSVQFVSSADYVLHPFCYNRMDKVKKLVSQQAVVVISSCCMCHTVKSLLHDLGVNAAVHELDEEPRGSEMEKALAMLVRRNPLVPLVFIGGKLVGSTDRIMSLHLGGELVPLLHEAGALWVWILSSALIWIRYGRYRTQHHLVLCVLCGNKLWSQ